MAHKESVITRTWDQKVSIYITGYYIQTSTTSDKERDTNESLELPSSKLGPRRDVPLGCPAAAGALFLFFSGEIKLESKLLSEESEESLGYH